MTTHVFDAYGTLLDVHAAVRRLADRIGPAAPAVSATLRAKQLEYSWVRTLGDYPWRDFRALTADALRHALAVHGAPADPGLVEDVLGAYDALDAFPDAEPALRGLAEGGARLAVLSNGSRAMLDSALGASGLAPLLAAVISADEPRRFKTAPDIYRLGCDRLGVEPGEAFFYSSNRWDVAAAVRFGFRAVWINRAGAPDEYADLAPERVVRSLAEIAG